MEAWGSALTPPPFSPGKHWSGLISGYYVPRAAAGLSLAMEAASTGGKWSDVAWNSALAAHAATWQLATNPYPTTPTGDARVVSALVKAKYDWRFAPYC